MRPSDSPRLMYGSTRPPAGRNGRFTAATASEPESAASTISAVSIEMRSWASWVWAPRCGVATTFGWRTSRRSLGGSSANTSSAAPPRCPASSDSSSASSSTTPPRRAVDDQRALLHLGHRLAVEQVAGLVRHRHVEGHHVRAGEQLVERQQLHLQPPGRRGVEERVVGHDLHLEAARPVRHPLADAAEADDAQGLALKLDAGELAVPLPRLHARRRPPAPGGPARGAARTCARWPTSGWRSAR